MKRQLLFFSLVLLATGGSLLAQNFNGSYNFVAKGTQGPGTSFANTGVTAFAISWTPTNTVASCAVQVDSSADNVSWGSGDLIASQNCAPAGSVAYATLASGKNFVRVNVTSIVGNGGLNVTLTGSSGGSGSGSTPGVFTNAQMNQPFTDTLTGGSSCNAALILNSAQTVKVTDAFAGCANTPATSVTNGWTNALAGYVKVNDPNQGGQFGKVQGVGVFGGCLAAANNTKCEGISPQVSSGAGLSGVVLVGQEVGVVPFNTTDSGWGILLSFEGGSTQPTSDNMPAVFVQAASSTGTFTTGFETADASISSTNTFAALSIGKQTAASGSSSQWAFWNANMSGSAYAIGIAANGSDSGMTMRGLKINNNVIGKRFTANSLTGATAYAGADAAIVPTGWGSGAAVSAAIGYDPSFTFTITAGTTPSANPTFAVTYKDGTWTNAPGFLCNMTAGNGAFAFVGVTSTATVLTGTYVGTPVNASTYIFTCNGMGR